MSSNIYLYHYFAKERGPFLSISDLPAEEAKKVIYNFQRDWAENEGREYVENESDFGGQELRRLIEIEMRQKFSKKCGKILKKYPYYLILRNDDPLMSDGADLRGLYKNGDLIKISVEEFDMSTVSFTYGDSTQNSDPGTFSDKSYWNQVYTYDEIFEIIKKYGWITKGNNIGWRDPYYIEAQAWSEDSVFDEYRRLARQK